MSYYLEVSASEVPPSSISESASKPKRPRALSTDDELKLYLFLKRIYSLFPRPDDILTEEETNSNILGNDAQLDHGTISLILVYSGTEIGVPAITKSAKRYGLSVFDFQSGQIVRRRQIVPTAKELSLYREAHKYLLEMAEWSKFSGELDQLAGAKDLEERLRKQAETGYGPAKRALSFHCYLNYTRSRDKDERRVNITQAYKLIREVSNTAYSSRSLLETYKQAAKHEGVTLEE